MEKNNMHLGSSLYYINFLGLIFNLLIFTMNLAIFRNLYIIGTMPIITVLGSFVSTYLKNKLELSRLQRYALNVLLLLNIIISVALIIIFCLLLNGFYVNQ